MTRTKVWDGIVVAGDEGVLLTDGSADADDPLSYHVTVPRALAERLAEHYREHEDVRSVPDALRRAARDRLAEKDHDQVQCDDCGARFAPSDAAGATFGGSTATYQCPNCGVWSTAPPPGY